MAVLHNDCSDDAPSKVKIAFWARGIASTLLVAFATVMIVAAVLAGETALSASFVVPSVIGLLILVVALVLLALVEGLQVAIVELKLQSLESYRHSHPRAFRLHAMLTQKQNVERFLIGRQIVVIFVVFAVALLTTLPGMLTWPGSTAPVPQWMRAALLASGLLGTVLVVNVAQLAPQIVAAYDPVGFLNYRICAPTVQLTLALEMTGFAHASWLLASAYITVAARLGHSPAVVLHDVQPEEQPAAAGAGAGAGAEHVIGSPSKFFQSLGQQLSTVQVSLIKPDAATATASATATAAAAASGDDHHDAAPETAPPLPLASAAVSPSTTTLADEALLPPDRRAPCDPKHMLMPKLLAGGKEFTSTYELARALSQQGKRIPAWLLPPEHPDHVPPHLVLMALVHDAADVSAMTPQPHAPSKTMLDQVMRRALVSAPLQQRAAPSGSLLYDKMLRPSAMDRQDAVVRSPYASDDDDGSDDGTDTAAGPGMMEDDDDGVSQAGGAGSDADSEDDHDLDDDLAGDDGAVDPASLDTSVSLHL